MTKGGNAARGGPIRLELLQSISLAVSRAQEVETVLQMIVRGLVERAGFTLARIWLTQPGDICSRCDLRAECPDQERCLHLSASFGRPANPASGEAWFRIDGDFQRFPLNVRIIGRIGATGVPEHRIDTAGDRQWIANNDWLKRERIRTFVGHPLEFRGEILGVLGAFTRERLDSERVTLMRLFADEAAVAIANARAFQEIQRLRLKLEQENEYLREEVRTAGGFGDIVGSSPALVKVMGEVELVANSDTTVLILGESGTGKELIARAIHERSPRRSRPMIKVNCSAIPHDLFESEFFGHVKGSFTGAVRDRTGRFELSDGGTLFLDEVGDIPLDLQGKLLRVLQEKKLEKVGAERTQDVDVRLISATNKDLQNEIQEGRFREDLYYRLSVFPLRIPSLRERGEDIPLLAAHNLNEVSRLLGIEPPVLNQRHREALMNYEWPGNIRELRNVIERACVLSQAGPLEFDFPGRLGATPLETAGNNAPSAILTYRQLKRLERDNLFEALESCNWKVWGPQGAANLLGVKPTTLTSKMRAMGLKRG